MRIVEQTPDRLVIETAPHGWDKLIFAASIVGSVAGFAAFWVWGWSFISAMLVLCVPVAALFLINYKSFLHLKHTYSLDKSRNEFVIREQRGSKIKQLRSTVSELKSLEAETLGTDHPSFFIVVRRKTLPKSMLEVEALFPGDGDAFNTIEAFLGR